MASKTFDITSYSSRKPRRLAAPAYKFLRYSTTPTWKIFSLSANASRNLWATVAHDVRDYPVRVIPCFDLRI